MAKVSTQQTRSPQVVCEARILGGEPTIAGTRVPVRSIVVGLERYGADLGRVAEAYRLDVDAVRAALAYYQAHREAIDALIRENALAAESTDEA